LVYDGLQIKMITWMEWTQKSIIAGLRQYIDVVRAAVKNGENERKTRLITIAIASYEATVSGKMEANGSKWNGR